jgi:hypothetical protein
MARHPVLRLRDEWLCFGDTTPFVDQHNTYAFDGTQQSTTISGCLSMPCNNNSREMKSLNTQQSWLQPSLEHNTYAFDGTQQSTTISGCLSMPCNNNSREMKSLNTQQSWLQPWLQPSLVAIAQQHTASHRGHRPTLWQVISEMRLCPLVTQRNGCCCSKVYHNHVLKHSSTMATEFNRN